MLSETNGGAGCAFDDAICRNVQIISDIADAKTGIARNRAIIVNITICSSAVSEIQTNIIPAGNDTVLSDLQQPVVTVIIDKAANVCGIYFSIHCGMAARSGCRKAHTKSIAGICRGNDAIRCYS